MKLCEYGCGQEAQFQFKNGKWCCSDSYNKCNKNKEINSKSNIGKNKNKLASIETRNKMSNSHKGILPSIKTRNKMSKTQLLNPSNGMKNKKHTQITRNKMKETHLLNPIKGFLNHQHDKLTKNKIGMGRRYSIKQIQEKYPIFAKIEEMRYKPGFEKELIIQVHCKNHLCKNSKEQDGWFTPQRYLIFDRIRSLELDNDVSNIYCSEECKHECPLFKKRVTELIKQDRIRAGHVEVPWYNSNEYQTWRTAVLEQDNYICQWCEEPAIVAHHILPQKTHPNFSLDPENGIACCEACHYKYGHRDKWCTTGYLGKLVCQRIYKMKNKEKYL